MTFAQLNLDTQITKAIQSCGYSKPTPIQSRCIPDILEGKDLVASAQTGTGKTAAFVLPALHKLKETTSSKKPRVLILTPTRELASQITTAAGKYGKFLRFNIVSLVGGMSYRQQIRDLSRNVDVVVATPGRLLDHMDNKRIDLSNIEMLVLDEADRMLDMGFIDDVKEIAKKTPGNRQTLLFSATVDNRISQVVSQLLKNPVRIDLSQEKISPINIKQEIYMADNAAHKARLLQHFVANGNIFKAIIFSATKINADKLAGDLRDQGISAAALHGDLRQSVRNRTVEQLRRGKIQFLVATDVAARGIDIADLTHVINFDLPKFSEDYVHRIGRTGRAGKSGKAISFVTGHDMRALQKIERYTGQKIQKETIEGLEPKQKQASPGNGNKNKSKGGFGKNFRHEKSDRDSRSFTGKKKERPSYKKEERTFSDKGDKSRRASGKRKFNDDRPFVAVGNRKERPSFNEKSSNERSSRPSSARGKHSFGKDERSSGRGDRKNRSFSRKDEKSFRPAFKKSKRSNVN